jgi:hypothetical protein
MHQNGTQLLVQPCRASFKANERFRLYYCPAERNFKDSEYLGIYDDKSVRLIGRISKVVTAKVDANSGKVLLADGYRNSIADDEETRIRGAAEEAKIRGWDLSRDHKFFLCDSLHETDFAKRSKHGLRNHRYICLKEILQRNPPSDVVELANQLRNETWE